MIIDARQMKKILVANGYEYKRCKGSHFMFSNGTILQVMRFLHW